MILIGYSDLNKRQIFSILEGEQITVDNKMISGFNLEKYEPKDEKAIPLDLMVGPYS